MKIWFKNDLKNWLKGNKIYFETLAATFLSLMAIVVMVKQCESSENQNKLTDDQNKLNQKQLDLTEEQLFLTRSQDTINKESYYRSLLNDSITNAINVTQLQIENAKKSFVEKELKLMELSQLSELNYGKQKLWFTVKKISDLLSYDERIIFEASGNDSHVKFFNNVRNILESEIDNPYIFQNKNIWPLWEKILNLTREGKYWAVEVNTAEDTQRKGASLCMWSIYQSIDSIYSQIFNSKINYRMFQVDTLFFLLDH